MLYYIILSVIVIICFLLIVVILLQPGQKEGLSGGLAAGMVGGAGMGARRTADLLSSTTTILATAFLVLSVLANFAIEGGGSTPSSTLQEQGIQTLPMTDPAMNMPTETQSAVPQQIPQDPATDASEAPETTE